MSVIAKRYKSWLLEAALLLFSLAVIVPLLIMFFGSFKSSAEASRFNIEPPSEWHWDNYSFVFETGGLLRSFWNSSVITAFSLLLTVIVASAAAFVISRRKSKATESMYIYFLIGMIAPMQIITTYAVLKILGLTGSFTGVILINAAINIPLSIVMFAGFVKGIPREIDEAAAIDGCGSYRLFGIIIMPLLKPVIASNIIFLSLGIWNDIMLPIYFLSGDKWTLPLSVYQFFGQYFSSWNYVFADIVLSAIPVVILFLTAQRYIVAGMVSGALKG
ncbi:carbohydrate ABC transporter permease [Cohnella cellulosilytica]|uniref:Carbohydrate ABC transporter permease n=1 Tax=Cohnella cellulosilytica TaxID=986710 RepID=A0ABW2F8I7_9BACL